MWGIGPTWSSCDLVQLLSLNARSRVGERKENKLQATAQIQATAIVQIRRVQQKSKTAVGSGNCIHRPDHRCDPKDTTLGIRGARTLERLSGKPQP